MLPIDLLVQISETSCFGFSRGFSTLGSTSSMLFQALGTTEFVNSREMCTSEPVMLGVELGERKKP